MMMGGRGVRSFLRLALLILSFFQGSTVTNALPAGFRDEGVARIGSVSTIAFIPKIDGSNGYVMFATIKEGIIRVIPNFETSGTSTTILDISDVVCNNGERGMHQVTPHPNFVVNRYIYITYTHLKSGACELDGGEVGGATNGEVVNRLSRFQVMDDYTISVDSEEVLLETDVLGNKIHNGGDILFGNDGYLYMTIGEDGKKDHAQRMYHVFGKVLRLTDDGGIPSDNPYVGANTARCNFGATQTSNICQEIYSTGFRNPYRFNLNPNTGKNMTEIYVTDVGGKSWEEVSVTGSGFAGANYGWPDREGPCRLDSYELCAKPPAYLNYQDPTYYYQHDDAGAGCITGGVIVPDEANWPPQYANAYLFFDFVWGIMYSIRKTSNGCRDCIPPVPEWTRTEFLNLGELNVERPVQMVFGPYRNGLALYYTVRSGQQNIRRFVYAGSDNLAPHAEFVADVTSGPVGTTVSFDSTGTNDPDGDTIEYMWDFGDGTTSDKESPTHKFDTTGNFNVQLTVVDEEGFEAYANLQIDIGTPPTPIIGDPAPGATFAVGDVFTLNGSAIDGDGNRISDLSMTWEVRQHHGTHFHPFLDPTTGNKITIDPAPSPEEFLAATNSHLEILLTATDATGFSATVSRLVMPKIVYLGFESIPPGMELLLDGYAVVTPVSVATWVNHPIKIEAKDQEGYSFQEWSDGGIGSHTFRVGTTNETYIATFAEAPGPSEPPVQLPTLAPMAEEPAAPTPATSTPAPFFFDDESPSLTSLGSGGVRSKMQASVLSSACLVFGPFCASLVLSVW